jgi:hypothetical protein
MTQPRRKDLQQKVAALEKELKEASRQKRLDGLAKVLTPPPRPAERPILDGYDEDSVITPEGSGFEIVLQVIILVGRRRWVEEDDCGGMGADS